MKTLDRPITVGQVARRTGLTPKAIRLYESRGLLPVAERTSAGYRTYTDRDIDLLRFVRQAKTLGMRLDEVKEIIDFQQEGAQPCGMVIELVDRRLREIDKTLRDLKALRKGLAKARDTATTSSQRGQAAVVCRIIESAVEA